MLGSFEWKVADYGKEAISGSERIVAGRVRWDLRRRTDRQVEEYPSMGRTLNVEHASVGAEYWRLDHRLQNTHTRPGLGCRNRLDGPLRRVSALNTEIPWLGIR